MQITGTWVCVAVAGFVVQAEGVTAADLHIHIAGNGTGASTRQLL